MAQPSLIANRYEIVGLIGSGGMGSVYRAKDLRIAQRIVALKQLKEGITNPEIRKRFEQEANAAGALSHDNIVRVFDVGEHEGVPFIAMEFIEGDTLHALINRRVSLPIVRKLQLMEELCDGLGYAHTCGIVHRDIKPANLIVDRRGRLKILDFGIAKVMESGMTNTGSLIGTFNYMSPEQMKSSLKLDFRSDIFSVGTVFYEFLSYQLAFPGAIPELVSKILLEPPEPIRSYCPDLDADIERALMRALEKSPSRRYKDLSVMQGELARIRVRLTRQGEQNSTIILQKDEDTELVHTPTPRPKPNYEDELAERRARQVDAHLATARAAFDNGDYEAASEACLQAATIDREDPRPIALLEQIRAAADDRRAAELVQQGQERLDRGAVSEASQLADDALAMRPDMESAVALKEAVRRIRTQARQVKQHVDRGRERLQAGAFEEAIAAAAAALEVNSRAQDAIDLRAEAEDALERQVEQARADQAAAEAVGAANAVFDGGDRVGAIRQLEAVSPSHQAIEQAIADLQRRAQEIEAQIAALVKSADVSRTRKAYGEALETLDAAERLVPSNDDARRLRKAVEADREAATQARQRAAACAELVAAAEQDLEAGRFEQGLAAVQRALGLVPEDRLALSIRQKLVAAQQKEEERRRIEALERRAADLVALAESLLARNDLAGAIRVLAEAGDIHPSVTALLKSLRDRQREERQRELDRLAHEEQQNREAEEQDRKRREREEEELARQRREREDAEALGRRVAEAVAVARRSFSAGRWDEALTSLSEFKPQHPLIEAAVRELTAEKDAIDRRADLAATSARADFAAGRQQEAISALASVKPPHPTTTAALVALRAERQRQIEAFDARARDAVDKATVLVSSGSHAEAIRQLESFQPAHSTVSDALARLRNELEALDRRVANAIRGADDQFRAGDHDDAIRSLESFAPPDARVAEALAKLRSAKGDLDRRAAAVIAEADKLLAAGERQQALGILEAFKTPHRDVREALDRLRSTIARLEDEERQAREAEERRSQQAARAVAQAERWFARGKAAKAIASLETFAPPHPLVDEALASLRTRPVPPPTPLVPPWVTSPVTLSASVALATAIVAGTLYLNRSEGPANPAPRPTTVVATTTVPATVPTTITSTTTTTALPNVEYVPISIDAVPWATVKVTAVNGTAEVPSGPYTTPLLLQLPAGTYDLQFDNGGISRSATRRLVVEDGKPGNLRVSMPGFDVDRAVDAVLGPIVQ